MLLVLPANAGEVKESRHFMRDLEFHLFLDCFLKITRKTRQLQQYLANTLQRAPYRKGGGRPRKGLEVDFSADETENDSGLISSEEEENTSSDSLMRCKGKVMQMII